MKGDWFLTYTGKQFWPLSPTADMVSIEDIAHHLAHICRFGGATREFYSVAQHSILVAQILAPHLSFIGLMHDATEAYCGDMVRPLKRSMPQFSAIEDGLWKTIAEKWQLPLLIPKEIKVADDIALITERRDLIKPNLHARPWRVDEFQYQPHPDKIVLMSPAIAEERFLALFSVLWFEWQRRWNND